MATSFPQVLAEEYGRLRPGGEFAIPAGVEPEAARDGLFHSALDQAEPFRALCISGGGIRSATFALGALQGLAERGLLSEFDYLSTVSGGGFIGGWLSAWLHRQGPNRVLERLRPAAPAPAPGAIDPVQHLREFNNYLTPKLGFFSADTWTLVATVTRNLFLNWLVLIPLLMFALTVPRLLVSLETEGGMQMDGATFDAMRTGWVVTVLLPLLNCALFSLASVQALRYLPMIGRKDHTQGDFLRTILVPVFGGAVCFTIYNSYRNVTPGFLLLWMLVPCVAGWVGYLVFCGKSWRERLLFLFGPMTVAVVTMGAFIAAATFLVQHLFSAASWAQWVTLGPPVLVLGANLALCVFSGLTSGVLADEDREWLARAAAWLLLGCFLWTGACCLALLAPGWAFRLGAAPKAAFAALGAASGWLSAFSGLAANPGGSGGRITTALKKAAIRSSPALFVALLAVALAMATNWLLATAGLVAGGGPPIPWWDHENLLENTPWPMVLAAALVFLAFGWLAAHWVNINKFSLHGMYRNRLIRAYLGASNRDRVNPSGAATCGDGDSPIRPPNGFTGFTESDNLAMNRLREQRPLHVVNTALNLVAGRRLAWQQRKAESFTISPLYCGNRELGYRPSTEYGGVGGITLGTAVAISGAAASPNMGYHSSPAMGMLLTLLNARLGAWLGNPGLAGEDCWKEAGPRSAVQSLVKEAFGLTTNTSRYVYLSDGGHFENLALYEMVLRRCRLIVVLDGGCDPGFGYEDLGNAVRKIRIDFGIPIEFPDDWTGTLRQRRCAVARIRYPEGPAGSLIYVKPMVKGDEPPDVATYHSSHSDFPYESTANQWFEEAQTESYRMLGLHTIRQICAGFEGGGLDRLREYIESRNPA